MKNLILIVSFFTLLAAFVSCKEDKLAPVEKDGDAPGPITSAEAESLPGAVKLTYTLPANEDLLYVMATYTNSKGRTFEAKASYYTNTLKLEGFADTDEYEVKLYAVDRSENKSEPYIIKVNSLKPPMLNAFDSLKVKAAFGGLSIQTFNKAEADLAIVLLQKDSTGKYLLEDTYYSKQDTILYRARGYDSLLTSFGVYVRDRWNNISDTLFVDIKPLYEVLLDKTKFKVVRLPGDAKDYSGLPMQGLWDNTKLENSNMYHSDGALPMPQQFTFDLGVQAKISRFTVFQRPGDSYCYNHGNPKEYEVYGSNNPDTDGGWVNWIKLASCVSVKPSDKPVGVNTSEDIAAVKRGEEWEAFVNAPAVRYIRVKTLKSWSGGTLVHIAEMDFYGNDK